jgi:hypothetical protein
MLNGLTMLRLYDGGYKRPDTYVIDEPALTSPNRL